MKVKAIDENLYLKDRKKQIKDLVTQDDIDKTLDKLKITTTILSDDISLATTSSAKTVNLNDSIQNYDMILISLRGDWNHMFSCIFLPLFLTNSHFNIESGDYYYVRGHCGFPTDKTFKVTPTKSAGWSGIYLNAVVGINFYKREE